MYSVVAAAKALYDRLEHIGESSVDGDAFLDLWIYVIIKANITDLVSFWSTVHYVASAIKTEFEWLGILIPKNSDSVGFWSIYSILEGECMVFWRVGAELQLGVTDSHDDMQVALAFVCCLVNV